MTDNMSDRTHYILTAVVLGLLVCVVIAGVMIFTPLDPEGVTPYYGCLYPVGSPEELRAHAAEIEQEFSQCLTQQAAWTPTPWWNFFPP